MAPKKFRRDKNSKIDSIVHATLDLIEERGYSGFSINEIPNRTNLSIGTVYRYFPDGKQDILREIVRRNNQAFMEMIAIDDNSTKDFSDFWRGVIEGYIRGHREGRFHLTALEYSFGADTQFKEVLSPIVVESVQELAHHIHVLQAFPTLTERAILERVALVFGIMGLLVKSHVRSPVFKSDDSLVRYLIEVSHITFEMQL